MFSSTWISNSHPGVFSMVLARYLLYVYPIHVLKILERSDSCRCSCFLKLVLEFNFVFKIKVRALKFHAVFIGSGVD